MLRCHIINSTNASIHFHCFTFRIYIVKLQTTIPQHLHFTLTNTWRTHFTRTVQKSFSPIQFCAPRIFHHSSRIIWLCNHATFHFARTVQKLFSPIQFRAPRIQHHCSQIMWLCNHTTFARNQPVEVFLSALPLLCKKDAILSEILALSRRVLFSVTGKAFLNL